MPTLEYSVYKIGSDKPFCTMFDLSRAMSIAFDLASKGKPLELVGLAGIKDFSSIKDAQELLDKVNETIESLEKEVLPQRKEVSVTVIEFRDKIPTGDRWMF